MTIKTLMTAQELWAMPEAPGKRFELVRGELIEVPGAGGVHGVITGVISDVVKAFVRLHALGRVFGDGVGFVVLHDPDIVRIPDVSFVRRDRISRDGIPVGFWPFAPDLAVEVVSPHDRTESVLAKVQEYLAGGSRLVWVAWPATRSVTAHRGDGTSSEYGPDDDLDAGDVLPGFRARVADLFDLGE